MMNKYFIINYKFYGLVLIFFLNFTQLYSQLHVGMPYKGGIIAYLNDDSTSGLILQKNDISLSSMDWWKATSTCENLRDSGFADWRLPTYTEWEKISFEVSIDGVFDTEWGRSYWTQTESEELVGWGGETRVNFEKADIFQWYGDRRSLWKSAFEVPIKKDGKTTYTTYITPDGPEKWKRISVRCLRKF